MHLTNFDLHLIFCVISFIVFCSYISYPKYTLCKFMSKIYFSQALQPPPYTSISSTPSTAYLLFYFSSIIWLFEFLVFLSSFALINALFFAQVKKSALTKLSGPMLRSCPTFGSMWSQRTWSKKGMNASLVVVLFRSGEWVLSIVFFLSFYMISWKFSVSPTPSPSIRKLLKIIVEWCRGHLLLLRSCLTFYDGIPNS